MRRKRLVWQLFPSYLLVTLLSLLALSWHPGPLTKIPNLPKFYPLLTIS
jgi:hypothetical protein